MKQSVLQNEIIVSEEIVILRRTWARLNSMYFTFSYCIGRGIRAELQLLSLSQYPSTSLHQLQPYELMDSTFQRETARIGIHVYINHSHRLKGFVNVSSVPNFNFARDLHGKAGFHFITANSYTIAMKFPFQLQNIFPPSSIMTTNGPSKSH